MARKHLIISFEKLEVAKAFFFNLKGDDALVIIWLFPIPMD